MTLPSSGAISLDDVQNEFGGTNPIQIDEYYSAADGVPASGTISLSDFYGKSSGPVPGQLWTWGYNYYGQLGTNGTGYDVYTPVTTFAGGTDWNQVACGFGHISAIKNDGTLWAWGANSQGQLGAGSYETRISTPVTVFTGGTNWKQVDCGTTHVAAIKTDGTLWVWGDNQSAALGTNLGGYLAQSIIPVTTFAGGTDWSQVACGDSHTAAIKTDGTLWLWGENYGKLGNNGYETSSTPVTTFAGGTNWSQVACGLFNTAAIKTDGTLWVWGKQEGGRLANNQTADVNIFTPITTFAGGTNWKQVSYKDYHAAAIKTDGTLWVWGDNYYGGLGGTNTTTINVNVSVSGTIGANSYFFNTTNTGGLPTYILTYTITTSPNNPELNITTQAFTYIENQQIAINVNLTTSYTGTLTFSSSSTITTTQVRTPITTFAGGTNWKQVDVGGETVAATKTDGTLWAWGFNYDGQLGTNDNDNRTTPVTTFAGGTNWKQVSVSSYSNFTAAIKRA